MVAKRLNDSASSPQICFNLNLSGSSLSFPWFSITKVSRVVNISEKLGAWGCGCLSYASHLGIGRSIRTERKVAWGL